MRADAQRNRDAILAAARTVFERDGILAPTDGIAVAAGVGNATLYRNFPTRDDLLAAVMVDSVDAILVAADELSTGRTPADALREWLFRLAWQLRIWQDMPTCIASALEDETSPVQDVCARLTARTGVFLAAAGSDVPAERVFELMTAVSWAIDRFRDDEAAARERVALATAGV